MSAPKYEPTGKSPAKVTGMPPTGDFADDLDKLNGGLEIPVGSGTQSGEHPAKTQSKQMRYY